MSPRRCAALAAGVVVAGVGAVPVPFDAANVVRLTDALLNAGLDEAAIRAVMGENVLRVLATALPAPV